MELLGLLLPLIILGLIAWGIRVLPIPDPFKTACYIVLVLVLVIVVFRVLGIPTGLPR